MMIALVPCCLLFCGTLFSSDVGADRSAEGDTGPSRVFNVLRYGAVGDDKTDNTEAFSACMKALVDVIRAEPSPGSYENFSSISVILKNLDVRTSDDPDIDGIDLHHAQQCKLENVFVNTGVYNVQASKPTHGTCGIITPAVNNAASTVLRDVVVTGYHSGIKVNEHTDGDNIVVASNINGLEFVKAAHASRFARVGAYRNTHHVTVAGKHGFSISQLNTEQPGVGQTDAANAWQTLVSDVHDPDNLGVADIDYWVVVGNDGPRDTFVKNGGTFIRARRIGSDPVDTAGARK